MSAFFLTFILSLGVEDPGSTEVLLFKPKSQIQHASILFNIHQFVHDNKQSTSMSILDKFKIQGSVNEITQRSETLFTDAKTRKFI